MFVTESFRTIVVTMAKTIVYRKVTCSKCRTAFLVKERNMNPLVPCPTGDSNVVNAGGEKITLEEGAALPLPELDESAKLIVPPRNP